MDGKKIWLERERERQRRRRRNRRKKIWYGRLEIGKKLGGLIRRKEG